MNLLLLLQKLQPLEVCVQVILQKLNLHVNILKLPNLKLKFLFVKKE